MTPSSASSTLTTQSTAGSFSTLTTRGLMALALPACLVMLLPVLALLAQSLLPGLNTDDSTFSELADTVLITYAANSAKLVALTLLFSLALAIPAAWWCAHYQFRGRKILQWLMVFPLAIPAYISAYIYTDLLDYAGPIQTQLRSWFGWQSPADYWFFDIRSLTGASLMLALALYPYLYLLLRNAFAQRSENLTHAAQLLGAGQHRIFWRIHLPMARPAIAIGLTLIAMETLADYGTVHLFAVSTLTTAVYDSWLVYGSISAAAKISCLLLLAILALVLLERYQRRRQQHFDQRNQQPQPPGERASTLRSVLIWSYCGSIITAGFVLPLSFLLLYCWRYIDANLAPQIWNHSQATFILALISAALACSLALLLNAKQRFFPARASQLQLAAASMGYAIPGTVLAIGLLIPLSQLDISLNHLAVWAGFERPGLILSGTSFALIMAFVIRFAAIANGSVQSAYQNMAPNLDEAARMLAAHNGRIFRRIHWPLLKPASLAAFLLVFIECVKELPASLLLRPFDFDTLATYVFQFASDEQLEHAASGALLIVIVGLLPIALLSRSQKMS